MEQAIPIKWCVMGLHKLDLPLEERKQQDWWNYFDKMGHQIGFYHDHYYWINNQGRLEWSIYKPSEYDLITYEEFQQRILKTVPLEVVEENMDYLIPFLQKLNIK